MYHASLLAYYQMVIEQLLSNQSRLKAIEEVYNRAVTEWLAGEFAHNNQLADYLITNVCQHLPPVIDDALQRANSWLLSGGVRTPDGAWGTLAGADSDRTRVANTAEALFGIMESCEVGTIKFSDVEQVVRMALSWAVKAGRDPSGAFTGRSFGVRSVPNTAMMIWLICTYPVLLTESTIPRSVLDRAVDWLSKQRHSIGGFGFYGQYEVEAERVFSTLWTLRAAVAYVSSPFCEDESKWQKQSVQDMLVDFLQSEAFTSTRDKNLISLKVTSEAPNPAMTGMLLTLLAECKSAVLEIGDVIRFIESGIDYLLDQFDLASGTWEDASEIYRQWTKDDEHRYATKAFSHMTHPWALRALSLNHEFLEPMEKVLMLKGVLTTILENQLDTGCFKLIDKDQDEFTRTNSIFGTAYYMYALAQVKRFAASL